jgi:hypothetical protein
MNFIVLCLTNRFCPAYVHRRKLRTVLSAAMGAGLFALFLLVLHSYVETVCALAFFIVPLMIFVAYGYGGWRQYLLRIIISWFSLIVLDGIMDAAYRLTGTYTLHLALAVVVLLIARVLVQSFVLSMRKQGRQMEVCLYAQGRQVCCMGLYDSGNLLTMPETGEPVHIIAPQVLRQLLRVAGQKPPGDGRDAKDADWCLPHGEQISYHALGTDCGEITVYQLDEMRVKTTKEWKRYLKPRVGAADEALLKSKSYQMILHSCVSND